MSHRRKKISSNPRTTINSQLSELLEEQPDASQLDIDINNLAIGPFLESIENLTNEAINRIVSRRDLNWSNLPDGKSSTGLIVSLLKLDNLVIDKDDRIVNPGQIKNIIVIHHPSKKDRLELYTQFQYLMPALSETIESHLNNIGNVFFIIEAEMQTADNTNQTHTFATLREDIKHI